PRGQLLPERPGPPAAPAGDLMHATLTAADRLIKDLGRSGRPLPTARALALAVLIAGPVYGAFMGSFHLVSAERALMVLYAAAKVPLLIFATSAVCLPGFFVLTTVLGLRDDFGRAIRAILA